MIRKGQPVTFKPEWQDPGDAEIAFIAVEDEDGGRVRVRSLLGLPINPEQVVDVSMIALDAPTSVTPHSPQANCVSEATEHASALAPLCYRCGWRKWGRDSWNGTSCKCKW